MVYDGRDEEEAPDYTTTDDEDDHSHEEKIRKSPAAAHAANVDEVADNEPHDTDIEPEDDTTEANPSDFNEQEESSHDADSHPCFDEVSEDNPEDELEPCVDYITRATHKADDMLAADGITSCIFRQSRIHWKQTRMIAKHHDDRWTKLISNWNPAISTKQKGIGSKEDRPRDGKTRSTHTYNKPESTDNNDLTNDTTWLTTAPDEMGLSGMRLCGQ